ncbi:MAG TPA: phosphatidylserine/phosphatidylglycerophosphate/cardiolipin synthase family protein [Ktedonobacterales bacterium]|nr:phosphatidylserine/phosphatidylglycerophosphate/cardiolipin synthase family protein [Ktedonobacterales bacterium]
MPELTASALAHHDEPAPTPRFPHLHPPAIEEGANRLQLYTCGSALYDAMLVAIDSARERIYLESFIWKDDAVGQEFKARLARKAAEGVAVYVVFDGFGNTVVPRAFKSFSAPIHALEYQAIRRPWHALDPRRYVTNHRKLLVVDGRIGFLGGYNLGLLYRTEWRDTHLSVEGPAAADLAHAFAHFWNAHGPRRDHIRRREPRQFVSAIQLWSNDALRLTFPIRNMYIAALDRAERQILLTNAYFLPDPAFLAALKAAAARGVDVQVMIPWRSNHAIVDWVARGYIETYLRAGMRVFGYQDVMLHAKTCTIDGQWSTIGTANLDRLSAVGNYELNAEIYSEQVAQQMAAVFACDRTNAHEVTLAEWARRSWRARLSERLLAPLRYLL